ncbi:MAG: uroporphyrinogen-III synthase [Propionibacteriaceae bacterium]|jgi:uroporphyrinogen-III synthase|nr:uroporphyrinogen-III synthase [Propionibacteriaceae bacterium]
MVASPNAAAARPLVWVAREPRRAGGLRGRLEAAGFRVVVAPATRIVPPVDDGPLAAAVRRLAEGEYEWVAATSVNTVEAVFRAAAHEGLELATDKAKWAVVGPATGTALERLGIAPSLTAAGSARSLAEVFPRPDRTGALLLPQSELAPMDLADALAGLGWTVDRVDAYRGVPAERPPELADEAPALVVVAAGSAARAVSRWLPGAAAVAIGEATSQAASQAGLRVLSVADEPSDDALTRAVIAAAATTTGRTRDDQ